LPLFAGREARTRKTALALSDQGSPAFDHAIAASFSAMGIPSFACTPDAFPELMAAAMRGEDMEGHVAKMRSE
jgi:hypothetical protein